MWVVRLWWIAVENLGGGELWRGMSNFFEVAQKDAGRTALASGSLKSFESGSDMSPE